MNLPLFTYIIDALQFILSIHLILPLVLLVIYSVYKILKAGKKVTLKGPYQKSYKLGVIVTAHRETTFIPPIVDSLLKQTYKNFEVYVVADDCDITDLHFDDNRVHILKPQQALNTNTKSIQFAIDHFSRDCEVMVLFDPDNLVHPKFLETLNYYYNAGYKAVQGNLMSKNLEGTYEKMDSVGVVFYNFVDREVRSLLGLSVNIWGCGVSVLTDIYKRICYDNNSLMGGFDKRMQAEIGKAVPQLAYAPEAILFDEKVSDSKNLEKQRIRWIKAYMNFLGDAFMVFLQGAKRGNFNQMYFGFNMLRPPYFLQILIAFAFIGLDYFVNPFMFHYWLIALSAFFVGFFTIIFVRSPRGISKGIFYMPLFFCHQVKALCKLKLNKTSILKTEHCKVVYIDDMLKTDQFYQSA